PPCSAAISSPPLTAVTVTVPYGNSVATAAVSTAPGSGTPMVTSTNMSLEVLPTIRKNPMEEWRIASETARLAALVASRPWTSTPMPISVIQRTRAIRVSCYCWGWIVSIPEDLYAAPTSSAAVEQRPPRRDELEQDVV